MAAKKTVVDNHGKKSDQLVIEVKDNGIGISKENIEKVRNPFFTTKSPTGGENIGVGLSYAYRTIESLGGHIELHSIEGKETTFTIIIPEN